MEFGVGLVSDVLEYVVHIHDNPLVIIGRN